MTEQQATDFFGELFGGVHHIPGKLKAYGPGWKVSQHGELATYDYNLLTRLVLLAHDRCVRAAVIQGGPGGVGIAIWQRTKRDGSTYERHPTIEQALEEWRKYHPMVPSC